MPVVNAEPSPADAKTLGSSPDTTLRWEAPIGIHSFGHFQSILSAMPKLTRLELVVPSPQQYMWRFRYAVPPTAVLLSERWHAAAKKLKTIAVDGDYYGTFDPILCALLSVPDHTIDTIELKHVHLPDSTRLRSLLKPIRVLRLHAEFISSWMFDLPGGCDRLTELSLDAINTMPTDAQWMVMGHRMRSIHTLRFVTNGATPSAYGFLVSLANTTRWPGLKRLELDWEPRTSHAEEASELIRVLAASDVNRRLTALVLGRFPVIQQWYPFKGGSLAVVAGVTLTDSQRVTIGGAMAPKPPRKAVVMVRSSTIAADAAVRDEKSEAAHAPIAAAAAAAPAPAPNESLATFRGGIPRPGPPINLSSIYPPTTEPRGGRDISPSKDNQTEIHRYNWSTRKLKRFVVTSDATYFDMYDDGESCMQFLREWFAVAYLHSVDGVIQWTGYDGCRTYKLPGKPSTGGHIICQNRMDIWSKAGPFSAELEKAMAQSYSRVLTAMYGSRITYGGGLTPPHIDRSSGAVTLNDLREAYQHASVDSRLFQDAQEYDIRSAAAMFNRNNCRVAALEMLLHLPRRIESDTDTSRIEAEFEAFVHLPSPKPPNLVAENETIVNETGPPMRQRVRAAWMAERHRNAAYEYPLYQILESFGDGGYDVDGNLRVVSAEALRNQPVFTQPALLTPNGMARAMNVWKQIHIGDTADRVAQMKWAESRTFPTRVGAPLPPKRNVRSDPLESIHQRRTIDLRKVLAGGVVTPLAVAASADVGKGITTTAPPRPVFVKRYDLTSKKKNTSRSARVKFENELIAFDAFRDRSDVPSLLHWGVNPAEKAAYIITEWVTGSALGDFCQPSLRIAYNPLFQPWLADRLFELLDACHSAGFAHNDAHLGNVMIDPISMALKLIDFGASYTAREFKTLAEFDSSPGFRPPSDSDEKSDMRIGEYRPLRRQEFTPQEMDFIYMAGNLVDHAGAEQMADRLLQRAFDFDFGRRLRAEWAVATRSDKLQGLKSGAKELYIQFIRSLYHAENVALSAGAIASAATGAAAV